MWQSAVGGFTWSVSNGRHVVTHPGLRAAYTLFIVQWHRGEVNQGDVDYLSR